MREADVFRLRSTALRINKGNRRFSGQQSEDFLKMGKLDGLKPEKVFYYFEQLSRIPRGSYNVKAVSDYCTAFAKSRGLYVRQDEEYNVVIKKPASSGYGSAKTLMLQAHLDMVCVQDPQSTIDMTRDGIELVVEDGFIHADHTSLGADDGIGVAMALAVLDDDTIAHPDLEVVFTTEEEAGMEGAMALDTSDLRASYLLNLDSENEGHFLAGCAGGVRVTSVLPMETEQAQGLEVKLDITGLIGGHSGDEIDKGRANANVLLGRLLLQIRKNISFGLVSVSGGEKDNAIPVESHAVLILREGDADKMVEIVNEFGSRIRSEFHKADPSIRVCVTAGGMAACPVMTDPMSGRVIFMLFEAPCGIQTMSMDLPGLVESSLNLGIVRTEDDTVSFTWSVRSSVASLKEMIKDKLTLLTRYLGGEISFRGDYPQWPYNPDSRICALCKEEYKKMFGKEAYIETIHAGLECGLFAEKMPGLDMVSMGPDAYDIHTPRERVSISSVDRCYRFILEVLKNFGSYCD